MYNQAEDLAYLVDFIPDASGIENGSKRMNFATKIWNPGSRFSDLYKFVLEQSQVVQTEVDENTKAKMEKVAALFTTTKKKRGYDDAFNEVELEVTEESDMVIKYREKMYAYEEAAMQYTSYQVAALSGSSVEAVNFFARNAHILRNRVKAAMNDWITNGYKELYEKATAFLEQVQNPDLNLLKAKYKDDLRKQ
ncbi:MAG: hypothetical protein HC892_16520 [Saprospiraceae bacterium]|nr:hypothetical protein [Saprospiraceae bacterium]